MAVLLLTPYIHWMQFFTQLPQPQNNFLLNTVFSSLRSSFLETIPQGPFTPYKCVYTRKRASPWWTNGVAVVFKIALILCTSQPQIPLICIHYVLCKDYNHAQWIDVNKCTSEEQLPYMGACLPLWRQIVTGTLGVLIGGAVDVCWDTWGLIFNLKDTSGVQITILSIY